MLESLLNKVPGLQACNFINTSVFLMNIAKIPPPPFPSPHIFICFNESPLKMMKNAFYFILKALFVLMIFKFLS